jgi:hypothetical protein
MDQPTVEFEGTVLEISKDEIKPGDTYVAERNIGIELLTAKEIVHTNGRPYIIPKEKGHYCYNVSECRKVTKILEADWASKIIEHIIVMAIIYFISFQIQVF